MNIDIIKYKELFVERLGTSENGYMRTTKLLDIFPMNCYLFADINNVLLSPNTKITQIPKMIHSKIPSYITINGIFMDNDTSTNKTKNNNILGDNSIFYCHMDSIQIPIIDCVNELLYFYNTRVIEHGEIFQIENKYEMPFFEIDIGKNYKNDYLLKEELGDGFYMEIHDTPHLHQPSNNNSNGFVVLGKKYKNSILLSQVKIPYGKVLYIPSNVYHSDSLLTGVYNVMYTKATKYQTYLFKTFDNKIVSVE
jgi:hypothetical protein